jgi:protein translocase SecG subunit
MKDILTILQIIIALLLMGAVLIQAKGTGFGRSWGGSTSFTRRGLEKLVFRATFVLSALFLIISTLQLVI